DGIRDFHVTGVQTCALPISLDLIKKQIEQADAGGLLLAGIDAWDELAAWTAEAEVPMVLVNGSDPNMRVSSVSPANFYGAYMAKIGRASGRERVEVVGDAAG